MKEVTVDYGTHKYRERWEHSPEIHCVYCGAQSVWVEQSPGDYYCGPGHLCLACDGSFTLQTGGSEAFDSQRSKQLKG